ERPSPHILVDSQPVLQRRKGALIAIEPLAKTTRRADGHRGVEVVEIVTVRVHEFARLLHRAADAHGHERVAGGVAETLADGAGHAKIRRAIRHLGELRADAAGSEERGVDVPPRTRSGEPREADAR